MGHSCPVETDGSVDHIGWLSPSIFSGSEWHIGMLSGAVIFSQAKRAADMQKIFSLIVAAFSFGSGCSFVWFLIGSLMAIML
jgi:magnesium-transporting ATPase (P-type)